jgi:hypothetical protein
MSEGEVLGTGCPPAFSKCGFSAPLDAGAGGVWVFGTQCGSAWGRFFVRKKRP